MTYYCAGCRGLFPEGDLIKDKDGVMRCSACAKKETA